MAEVAPTHPLRNLVGSPEGTGDPDFPRYDHRGRAGTDPVPGADRRAGIAEVAVSGTWDGITAAGLVKERYSSRRMVAAFHRTAASWKRGAFPHERGRPGLSGKTAGSLRPLAASAAGVSCSPLCVGGEASARFVAAPSVGASGGLMGWLGFLMVFETLHKRLVPRRAQTAACRRRRAHRADRTHRLPLHRQCRPRRRIDRRHDLRRHRLPGVVIT